MKFLANCSGLQDSFRITDEVDQMYISTLLIDSMAIWSVQLLTDSYTLFSEFLHGFVVGGSGIKITVGADVEIGIVIVVVVVVVTGEEVGPKT